MDPEENLIQYVKSLGEELCIKKKIDVWNGLPVNKKKANCPKKLISHN